MSRNNRIMPGESTPWGGRYSPGYGAGLSPSIQAKCSSTASTSLVCSASIAAIDIDIAVREVAGPDARLALRQSHIDRDLDLTALNSFCRRRFVVLSCPFASIRHDLV